MIEKLIAREGTGEFAEVVTEAYFAAGRELVKSSDLRAAVIERISRAPLTWPSVLNRFNEDEVAPLANKNLGRGESMTALSQSYTWLIFEHQKLMKIADQLVKLRHWQDLPATSLSELVLAIHKFGGVQEMKFMMDNPGVYEAEGLQIGKDSGIDTQAEIAFIGLSNRTEDKFDNYLIPNLLLIFQILMKTRKLSFQTYFTLPGFFKKYTSALLGAEEAEILNIASFLRHISKLKMPSSKRDRYFLDERYWKLVPSAVARRLEIAVKTGKDPGWPKNLPQKVKRMLIPED